MSANTQTDEISAAIEGLKSFVAEERNLVHVLLQGYGKRGKNGRESHFYLKNNSAEENEAREILCNLLRSGRPLTQYIRDLLAALFDPREDQHPAIARRIVFKHRPGGKPQNEAFNHTLIATHVYEAVKNGATVESGVETAITKFGLKERQIRKIWGRYRAVLETLYGTLPRPRRGGTKENRGRRLT